MKKAMVCIAGFAIIVVMGVAVYSAEPSVDHGKEVYAAQKCMMCHSIAGAGNKMHTLDGIGSKMKADEIKKFVINPKAAKPDIIMRAYADLPEKDLDDLVAYLMTLKK